MLSGELVVSPAILVGVPGGQEELGGTYTGADPDLTLGGDHRQFKKSVTSFFESKIGKKHQ